MDGCEMCEKKMGTWTEVLVISKVKKECKNCKLRIWGSVLGGKHEIWSELKEAI